jgi:hypothetical protein
MPIDSKRFIDCKGLEVFEEAYRMGENAVRYCKSSAKCRRQKKRATHGRVALLRGEV